MNSAMCINVEPPLDTGMSPSLFLLYLIDLTAYLKMTAQLQMRPQQAENEVQQLCTLIYPTSYLFS